MTTLGNLPEGSQRVVVATKEHAGAISTIYQSVIIDPHVLLDLVSASPERSTAALQTIKKQGGFLSPPSDADMQTTLQYGLVMVFLQDGEVAGFNRYVTEPEAVHKAFFTEFQLAPSENYSSKSFQDWTGNRVLKDHKALRRIHWIDREQALVAVNAAQAGLQGKAAGRLAWAIDSAVHPEFRHLGIGKTLSKCMRESVTPGIGFLAYRMFELRKVNGDEITIYNTRSRKTFVDSGSRLFAFTEEDIDIRSDVQITVRWNHWLKHYI